MGNVVTPSRREVPARLGLWDTASIIVGIIVGVGIFAPAEVYRNVSGPWQALGVWVLAGLLSLVGALCFAELATTYPRSGGDYVYLSRAYGPGVGFLFAWVQLALIRTAGGIAAPAYVFAYYARALLDLGPASTVLYAVGAIVVLSLINVLGVNPGRRTQNLLTAAKVLGLGGVLMAALLADGSRLPAVAGLEGGGSFAAAMIFAFYAYDGWNEAAYVAAEVRDRRRNLPRALILGTAGVAVLYLLINGAYLAGLGFDRVRASPTVAADLLALAGGGRGARLMGGLVMISALGGINGMIFTGSRLYSELGADHRLFAPLARWDRCRGAPVRALVIQAAVCAALVVAVGLWGQGDRGFEALVRCTSTVFWLFFFLTSLSLVVLRFKEPGVERPFRVPFYPLLPLVFTGWCGYMLCGSLLDAPGEALVGLGVLAAGLPLYRLSTPPAGEAEPAKSPEAALVSTGPGA